MLRASLAWSDATAAGSAPARQCATVLRLRCGLFLGLHSSLIPTAALAFLCRWNSSGSRIDCRDRASHPGILSSGGAPHRPPGNQNDQRGAEQDEDQPPIWPAPRPQHRLAILTVTGPAPMGQPDPPPLRPGQPIPTMCTKVHALRAPSLSRISVSLPVSRRPALEGWRGGGVEGWRGCDPIGIAAGLARLDAQTQSPYHTPSPDDGGGDFEAPAPSREGAVATPPSSEGIKQA